MIYVRRPYLSTKGRDERIDMLAGGKHSSTSYLYAGVFYNENERYMKNVAKYFNLLIKGDTATARNELEKMLTMVDYEIKGKAIYDRSAVLEKKRLFPLFDGSRGLSFLRKDERRKGEGRVNILELKVRPPSDLDKVKGLAFLKLKGYTLTSKMDRELEWQARETLLNEWIKLTDNDGVKKYLEEVREVYGELREIFITGQCVQAINRLAFYLFPIELNSFNNAVMISRASLYERRKPASELWDELYAEFKECRMLDELEYVLKKREKDLNYLKEFLVRAMSEETLKLLRGDWKEIVKKFLKGESDKVVGVFVGKERDQNPPSLSYGEYIVPAKPLRITVYAESGFKLGKMGAKNVAELLKRYVEDFLRNKYLGDVNVEIELGSEPLESLFYNEDCFKLIRGDSGDLPEIRRKDTIDLLHGLNYFATRLLRLAENTKDEAKNELESMILLLNTELEENDGRYPLWPVVRFVYNYYGVPVQTITKRAIRAMGDLKSRNATLKNLFISLYKDFKVLRFRASGFKLPQNTTVYAIVERTSPLFFYDRSKPEEKGSCHRLYEIYRIDINNGGDEAIVTIRVEDKVIEIHGTERASALEEWLYRKLDERGSRFCFITPHRESRLHEIYDNLLNADERGRSLVIVYKELKTAYFPESKESDCYIIYTQEVEKLFEGLGIQLPEEDKDKAVLAVKPAHPKSMEEYEIYHPSLQLFFAERVGWERDEVYSEKKSLFILTILALSMFESESFITPYSKLDLQMKEKNYYLTILRDHKEFKAPLKSVIYEALGFLENVPGKATSE